MSIRKLTLSHLLLFGSLFCSAQNEQRGTDPDKKSIDSLVDRIVSDWNTHEFKNMNSYATEDVDWVNLVGMWWRGRTEVMNKHIEGFNYFFKGVPFTRKV